MKWLGLCLWLVLGRTALCASEPWQEALSTMPLGTNVTQLDRINCVPLLLSAFQSNPVVKALVFMPGATDEFYMFRRAKAALTNTNPTLLDAITALTNQTLIRVAFQPPFLLLCSDEDPLDLKIQILHQPTVDRIRQTRFLPHLCAVDQDWDAIQPLIKRTCKIEVLPWRYSRNSWHFYRHSFAAWNLTGWEALQVVALAGKTGFTVSRTMNFVLPQSRLVFEADTRARSIPTFTEWPK